MNSLQNSGFSNYCSSTWRLIPWLEAPGHFQMALDRWLFEQHCLGVHPPTLRFYSWLPAAISLGYHQRRYPQRWHDLTWKDKPLDVVHRPTGGRAVLHQGDLTYAVVTSGMPGSRVEAYQKICQFLIAGWRSLGVSLDYGQAGRGYIHNPNCFGTATGADLVLPNGFKLIGSAQLRRGNAILQHGSMRLQTDPALFEQVFENELGAIDLPFSLSDPSILQKIIDPLTEAACRCFGIDFVMQPLSPAEWQAVLAEAEKPQA